MNMIIFFLEHKQQIFNALKEITTGVVALSAVLAAWLPKPGAGGPYDGLRKVIDLLGQNYRNAENK